MNRTTATVVIVIGIVALGILAYLAARNGNESSNEASSLIQWHSYDEGLSLARQQNKKLLIDVYTDWCVWCKKMDKEVYANESVANLLNKQFVAVKLDAESNKKVSVGPDQLDEATLAKAMGVTGYPTTVFLEAGTEPITKVSGYMQAKEFATVLRFIGEEHYKSKTFDQFRSSQASTSTD